MISNMKLLGKQSRKTKSIKRKQVASHTAKGIHHGDTEELLEINQMLLNSAAYSQLAVVFNSNGVKRNGNVTKRTKLGFWRVA